MGKTGYAAPELAGEITLNHGVTAAGGTSRGPSRARPSECVHDAPIPRRYRGSGASCTPGDPETPMPPDPARIGASCTLRRIHNPDGDPRTRQLPRLTAHHA